MCCSSIVTPSFVSPQAPLDQVNGEPVPNRPATKEGVMAAASSSSTGAVSIALHPLVIMNVAEHYTRTRAQDSSSSGPASLVIGALIGRQRGRNLEVMNSFELLVHRLDVVSVDKDYYETKEGQFKQVFPELDFLGWYTIGDHPTVEDINIHKQICEINESPIFMKLNPLSRQTKLPITLYESVIDLVNGEATLLFSPVPFSLATEEAERIGLDHMARLSNWTPQGPNGEASSSVAADQLKVQYNAVKMLRDRVRIIRDFVIDARDGKVEWNHDILREAHNLSNRLPLINSNSFRGEFYNQCNDVALMTYLGMLTKATNDVNQFVNKFNTLYDRHGMGRRMKSSHFLF